MTMLCAVNLASIHSLMTSIKKDAKFFAEKDGRRICQQQCSGGRCGADFAMSTGLTTLETHYRTAHKVQAEILGLFKKVAKRANDREGAAAAAAAERPAVTAGSSSQTDSADSVVDMILDSDSAAAPGPGAAVGHKRGSSAVSAASNHSAAKRAAVQPTLQAAFMNGNNIALLDATALFFATSPLGHMTADTDTFAAFCNAIRTSTCALPHRNAVKGAISRLAARMKETILQRLRGSSSPVTVAIDGWTNVRQTKVTNVVLLCSGVAYYWRSIPNTYDANTAEWLEQQLTPVLRELHQAGIRFSALVADNEAVNDALWARLLEPFPFLIRVPCAAHTVQLVVLQIMEIRRFERVLGGVRHLIRQFEKSKADRLRLRQLQSGGKEYSLVKPCDTRWNSQLYCCERLLKLRVFINIIFVQADTWWAELELLCAFLRPFQKATDVLQRDAATLFDVWLQKRALQQHIAAMKPRVGVSVVTQALAAVQRRWSRHVNQEATHAVALLSLIADTSSITHGQLSAAKQFILSFGFHYLRFFRLVDEDMLDADLQASLLHQLGSFSGRREEYMTLEEKISCARRASTTSCSALDIWDMYGGELPVIAKALLSITASEAAVERTFSAQDAVHTKRRNRLLDENVQNEMCVAFNHRALNRAAKTQHEVLSYSCMDLSPDADLDAALAVDSDAETEEESLAELVVLSPAAAEPALESAAAAAAGRAAPFRSQSMLEGDMRRVLDEYIADHGITLAAFKNRRYWTGDRQNALQAVLPPAGFVVRDAIAAIKSILEEQHEIPQE
jgi:hypothetical protein